MARERGFCRSPACRVRAGRGARPGPALEVTEEGGRRVRCGPGRAFTCSRLFTGSVKRFQPLLNEPGWPL